jgi:hypothetical protein
VRRRPVNSSSVRTVGWTDGTLEIEYISGDVYQYYEVPQPTFAALLAAESIGAYVNEHIKPYFEFREI